MEKRFIILKFKLNAFSGHGETRGTDVSSGR